MKKTVYLILILISFTSVTVRAFDSFTLINDNKGTSLYYSGSEQVVETALQMLLEDSKLVCETPFTRINEINENSIIVGIPERESTVKTVAERCKVNTTDLNGKWEAFKITKAEFEGKNYLFVLGSDPRGTAYGVLELSRLIGVSPWVWWADVVPEMKSKITIIPDGKIYAPSVQYRGIFLNDEDWALMPWSTRTFEPTSQAGAIGPKTYAKIFELLLRLRANTIWPAMHECTVPFFLVEGNKEMAEKYGIVLGTSHAEPMMRTNTGEWDNTKYGDFNFFSNKNQVLNYWEERVKELTQSESVYTIGMRGVHDGRMQGVNSIDDETKILHNIIDAQRDMLKRNNPKKKLSDIPQVFVPYKEVLKAYNNGLKLPDDVTLVWCDDNHGYIMRHGNAEEQKRSGGAGVYYHVSYWGKPHDYLWLGSTQPALIYAEMKRAWDNNARRLWILNVGDIKPNEYLTEFFLDMAWSIDSFAGNTIYAHQQNWIKTVFGNAVIHKIDFILQRYYHLAGQRKPEHTGWNKVEDYNHWDQLTTEYARQYGLMPIKDSELSPVHFGDEIEHRTKAYREIADLSKKIYENEIPEHLKPAYFQLVHYPVCASSAMNCKMLYAQKSRLYAKGNPDLARCYADMANEAYNEICALDYTYNKVMLYGKWELMMDMKPRDLPVFQEPVLPQLAEKNTNKSETLEIPTVVPLSKLAGTPVESDRMIALNASSYSNNIQLEQIEGLGHSGSAVRLPPNKKMNKKQAYLEYAINTVSSGDVRIKIGTIPMHSVKGTELRYAVVIDKQQPYIVSAYADFLSDKWADNVLRNQTLIEIDAHINVPGKHTIRIYALDEEMIFDQLMLEFEKERRHYLIPVS